MKTFQALGSACVLVVIPLEIWSGIDTLINRDAPANDIRPDVVDFRSTAFSAAQLSALSLLMWWAWNDSAVNVCALCSFRFWRAVCTCRCGRVDRDAMAIQQPEVSCVDVLLPPRKHVDFLTSPTSGADPTSPLLSDSGRRTPLLPVAKSARTISGNLRDSVHATPAVARTASNADDRAISVPQPRSASVRDDLQSRFLSDPVLQFSTDAQ